VSWIENARVADVRSAGLARRCPNSGETVSEIIDVFDGNRVHIGTFERAAAHRQGLWHQTFHCWIVGEDRDGAFVLLQLRSPTKETNPGMLDITAAGHLEAGETPFEGLRELEEELGVQARPEQLVSLGIKHDVADDAGGLRNREFAHVFLLRDDRDLGDYRLAEDEVAGLVKMRVPDGLALFSGGRSSVSCVAVRVDGAEATTFDLDVKATDLVARVDPYYYKIFIMAELFLEGRVHLSI
jgi:8-oxo-dGTP pyrophosphatase MutT (NUDIX family)